MKIKHLLALALVALFAAFGPAVRTAPTRYALLIGISDYTNFGDEIGGDLPGAVNDARAWRDVLVAKHGFPEGNIKMLLDGEATRAGIESAMTEWLRSVVRPGDHVFFMFAGHGSQMWDTDGDEDDGLDETICPADVTKGSTDRDISDDEIASWLNAIPTDDIVVFWDKCHAESSTRAATPFSRPRSLSREVTNDVPKPSDAKGSPKLMVAGERTAEVRNKPILEFAASQSDEVAVDAGWLQPDGTTRFGGAFTTLAVRNLWNAPAGTSYREIFEQTRQDLKRERFAQQPSLTGPGARDRAAFVLPGEPAFAVAPGSAPTAAGNAGVPVLSVAGGEVELGGGSAAGVTLGSVYRAGASTLRVTRVDANRARAVVDGGKATIAAGARASLVAYAMPQAKLAVSIADLSAAQRAVVTKPLAALKGVEVVTDVKRFAQLIVRPQGGDLVVIGLDGATRHVIAGGDGAKLAAAVEREQGANALAQLENPLRPFPLEFALTSGKTSFKLGDEISFRVKSGRAGYLTIVDLGTDGSVSVIYPNEYVKDGKIAAGEVIELPNGSMRQQEVIFEAQQPFGRGIVRAFVTDKPLKLPFTQASASQAGLVSTALREAAGGSASAAEPLPLASWATAALVYEVQK